MDTGTAANVKRAVLGHFTLTDIKVAKEALFNACDSNIIGEFRKRKTSVSRSDADANMTDIIDALITLDKQGQRPSVAMSATDLSAIPRSRPEELNDISVVDRVNQLEETVEKLKSLLDKVMADNTSLNIKLKLSEE